MNYLNEAVLIIAIYALIKSISIFRTLLKVNSVSAFKKEIEIDYEKRLRAVNSPYSKTLVSMARQIGFAVSSVLIIASSYALYFVLK